jgi:PAS domain S-box-containing protein
VADTSRKSRDKLSRTMRIDIAPGSLDAPPGAKKAARVISRKSKHMASSSGEVAAMGDPGSDFQELLQGVYDAALITDMSGTIVESNVRAVEFLLYSKEELGKLNITSVISGSDESLIPTISQNLKERFILIEQCYCGRKNGSFFPAEIAVNQLLLSGEDFFCFFVRDVTLRREAEKQLKIEHNAIRNSSSGIALTDLDAKLEYVNPAMRTMWGYGDSAELIGKDVRDLWVRTDGDDEVMETVIVKDETWLKELVAKSKDGSEFDVQVTAASNRDQDEEMAGMVFSFVDIGDRKRAEAATRETEQQRVMLESLGAACHHLGQPATVLLANLGIMQRSAADGDEKVQDMVTTCMEAAESVSEILHKLNAVNEYRTTPYLEDASGEGDESRIIEI